MLSGPSEVPSSGQCAAETGGHRGGSLDDDLLHGEDEDEGEEDKEVVPGEDGGSLRIPTMDA